MSEQIFAQEIMINQLKKRPALHSGRTRGIRWSFPRTSWISDKYDMVFSFEHDRKDRTTTSSGLIRELKNTFFSNECQWSHPLPSPFTPSRTKLTRWNTTNKGGIFTSINQHSSSKLFQLSPWVPLSHISEMKTICISRFCLATVSWCDNQTWKLPNLLFN